MALGLVASSPGVPPCASAADASVPALLQATPAQAEGGARAPPRPLVSTVGPMRAWPVGPLVRTSSAGAPVARTPRLARRAQTGVGTVASRRVPGPPRASLGCRSARHG